jgi:hypothetical protein
MGPHPSRFLGDLPVESDQGSNTGGGAQAEKEFLKVEWLHESSIAPKRLGRRYRINTDNYKDSRLGSKVIGLLF